MAGKYRPRVVPSRPRSRGEGEEARCRACAAVAPDAQTPGRRVPRRGTGHASLLASASVSPVRGLVADPFKLVQGGGRAWVAIADAWLTVVVGVLFRRSAP